MLKVVSLLFFASLVSCFFKFDPHEVIDVSLNGTHISFSYRNSSDFNCQLGGVCSPGNNWRNTDKERGIYEFVQILPADEANIPSLPKEGFYHMKNIQSFTMTNHSVENVVMGDFENARNLQFLNLSLNAIGQLDFSIFENASNIKVIDLSHNKISELSNTNSVELSLEELYLHYNQLVSFDSYWVLSNINVLTLNNNNLMEVKPNVTTYMSVALSNDYDKIRGFAAFNISNNPLGEFPGSANYYDNLINAFTVDLSNIGATEIFVCETTRILIANRNNIAIVRFEKTTPIYDELNELHLSDNFLESFDQFVNYSLFTFPNLELLDLSYNLFENIDSSTFSTMKHLEHLNLSHNKLLKFETDSYLSNLKVLSVSYNPLSQLQLNNVPSNNLKLYVEGLTEIDFNILNFAVGNNELSDTQLMSNETITEILNATIDKRLTGLETKIDSIYDKFNKISDFLNKLNEIEEE